MINLILILFIHYMVLRPLRKHIRRLHEISTGNLADTVPVKGQTEFARLAIETNATILRLNQLVSEIQESSSETKDTYLAISEDLSHSTDTLSAMTHTFET